MSRIPQSMHAGCPECGTETLHRTLKGRFRGGRKLELVLKCAECGRVHREVLEAAGRVPVRTIISRDKDSEKLAVDLPADWHVTVGDEFMNGDERLLVTGIESSGKRVRECDVRDIGTLWTVNIDTVRVRVSVNRGGRTRSLEMDAGPEDGFTVGQELEVDGVSLKIHSIKTRDRKMRRGSALARDISRIYCTDFRPDRKSGRRKR